MPQILWFQLLVCLVKTATLHFPTCEYSAAVTIKLEIEWGSPLKTMGGSNGRRDHGCDTMHLSAAGGLWRRWLKITWRKLRPDATDAGFQMFEAGNAFSTFSKPLRIHSSFSQERFNIKNMCFLKTPEHSLTISNLIAKYSPLCL